MAMDSLPSEIRALIFKWRAYLTRVGTAKSICRRHVRARRTFKTLSRGRFTETDERVARIIDATLQHCQISGRAFYTIDKIQMICVRPGRISMWKSDLERIAGKLHDKNFYLRPVVHIRNTYDIADRYASSIST